MTYYEMYNAFLHAPIYHLIFEAFLAFWIIKLLCSQSYRLKNKVEHALTEKEKEELINEWKPEPIVDSESEENSDVEKTQNHLQKTNPNFIDHYEGPYIYLKSDNEKEPSKFLDFASFNFLGLAGISSHYTPDENDKTGLSNTNNNVNLEKQPPSNDETSFTLNHDSHVLALQRECVRGLETYGVGACGPRGFYGTIDVHLKLEKLLAYIYYEIGKNNSDNDQSQSFKSLLEALKFGGRKQVIDEMLLNRLESEDIEGCIYSYGLATASSIIPAFSKRDDVIFVDEACHFGIQKGLQASRSIIKRFRHNDMAHLKRILLAHAQEELKDPLKAKVTKKFIVVEGLYQNTGIICDLPSLCQFRREFKARLFVDDSCSFGTIGPRKLGILDYFSTQITLDDIDLILGSLEFALGSIGGYCVGKKYLIENNYLSGLGYCFSASLPPIQACASIQALLSLVEIATPITRNSAFTLYNQWTTHSIYGKWKDVCLKILKQKQTLLQFMGDDESHIRYLAALPLCMIWNDIGTSENIALEKLRQIIKDLKMVLKDCGYLVCYIENVNLYNSVHEKRVIENLKNLLLTDVVNESTNQLNNTNDLSLLKQKLAIVSRHKPYVTCNFHNNLKLPALRLTFKSWPNLMSQGQMKQFLDIFAEKIEQAFIS